jgi:hypothetical protein
LAAAVHRADISGANIPAVSLVITAIMPACCHQGNQAVGSLPIVAVKSQIKGRAHSFPSLIANHSQLQQRTPEMLLNGIV